MVFPVLFDRYTFDKLNIKAKSRWWWFFTLHTKVSQALKIPLTNGNTFSQINIVQGLIILGTANANWWPLNMRALFINQMSKKPLRIPILGKCAVDECLKGILHCGMKMHWLKMLGNYMK